jgi:hypothetical protein
MTKIGGSVDKAPHNLNHGSRWSSGFRLTLLCKFVGQTISHQLDRRLDVLIGVECARKKRKFTVSATNQNRYKQFIAGHYIEFCVFALFVYKLQN